MTKMINLLIILWVWLPNLALTATIQPQQNDPPPVYLPWVSILPQVVIPPEDEASRRIQVPPGFEIRIFAQSLPSRPRFMAFGPDGNLYVTLMNAGQVARLPDANRDGLSDSTQIILSGLNQPHGIEWRDGWMYVAEIDRVQRFMDQDGNGSLETVDTILSPDDLPVPAGHNSRTIHFGPDGKLYLAIGSSCNACVESDPRRAAILRYNPDGSIPSDNPYTNHTDSRWRPVWAWGLRNSVDFLFTASGEMWANQNGSDLLGDDLPPEEIVIPIIQPGSWFGWPACYTSGLGITSGTEIRVPADSNGYLAPFPPGTNNCAAVQGAIFTAPAHSAPLGMTQAENAAFPPEFRTSLYVAYHGSWNTNDPDNYRDCKVERILLDENGIPAGTETFAGGWREPGKKCNDATTWGRPADVIIGPQGDMFISDDKGMRIYRVFWVE